MVLAKITAPASRRRAAGGASTGLGATSRRAAVPSGIGTPRVAMFSFTVAGTPSRASAAPRIQRASDSRAAARAASGAKA